MYKLLLAFGLGAALLAGPWPVARAATNFAPKPASPVAVETPPAVPENSDAAHPDAAHSDAAHSDAAHSDAALVESKIEMLDLRGRVAQLMLVTMQGFEGPDNTDRALLKACVPGGVVIPAVLTPGQAADYVEILRGTSVEAAKGIPLLFACDLYAMTQAEGRMPVTFAQLPSLLSLGAAADIPATERLAGMLARHLSVMGFNMNLGPSLELAPTLADAPGDTCTFGSDPAFAAQAGTAMVKTLIEGGIIPAPMGFPGGGHDRQGRSPAVLLTARAQLAAREFLPYRAAIEAGASVLNVGNTLVPSIDAERRPACLSPEVYRILREELKFAGIALAGPIDSPDITRLADPAEAAVLALKAGADMIYWTGGGDRVTRGVETVARAIERGEIPQAQLDASVRRVLGLKRANRLSARPLPSREKVDALERKKVANESYLIERNSITLVKNRASTLPLAKDRSMPIGVTGTVGVDIMKEALEEHIKPILEQPIRTAQQLGEIEDFEITRLTGRVRGMRTAICIFTGMRQSMGEARLIRELKNQGVRVVVLLLGYPKNLPQLAEADAILLAYCDAARYASSIRAAADILAGVSPVRVAPGPDTIKLQAGKPEFFDIANVVRAPTGRLPVNIAIPFVAGYSVSYAPQTKKAEWDFGDGARSKDARAEHAYKTPGAYTLTLTITDLHGEKTAGSFAIVVE